MSPVPKGTGLILIIIKANLWYPQQESNLHLRLRRALLYPLSYEGEGKFPLIL